MCSHLVCLWTQPPAELGRLQEFGSKERNPVVIDWALEPVPAVTGAGGHGLQGRQWCSGTAAPCFVHCCSSSLLIALTFEGKREGKSSVSIPCCFLPKKVKLFYVSVLLRSSKRTFWGFMCDFFVLLFLQCFSRCSIASKMQLYLVVYSCVVWLCLLWLLLVLAAQIFWKYVFYPIRDKHWYDCKH